ncbi:MAG: FAD-binding and (Fe-S)-binding domain-containing protein [Candidatus Dormibacteraeota bacterium]|nr:FAD-binding and (Fe-S)-binding domain-containing protein [Candidatus Dormibacteraeota bacterium]
MAPTLERDLRDAVLGEVRFAVGDRALYATDASNYRQVPIGIVVPRSVEDLVRTVDVCRAHDVPLLPRGGGTSLAGQGCNTSVIVDCSKYLRAIPEIDPERRVARVEPGVVLDTLRQAAEVHHLTFGPDPATHAWCTVGGMIGNNSCGVHSIMAGKTDVNVEEMEVLTYDGFRLRVGPTSPAEIERIVATGGRRGDIYRRLQNLRDRYAPLIRERYPRIPRRVSGYNLDFLLPERGFHVGRALVGSEGTCVTVLQATLRLVSSPSHRALLVLGYPDVVVAAEAVPEILPSGCIGLEGFDDFMVNAMRENHLHVPDLGLLPEGRGWLLVEFGGDTPQEAAGRAYSLAKRLATGAAAPSSRVVTQLSEQHRLWAVRESGLPATARVPGERPTWEGWEDAAVPPDRLGGYLRDLRALVGRFGYRCPMYGHFGDGCVHNRITFDFGTLEGVARYRSFVEEAAELVVSYGGSLSGEHGDGQSRGELLERMFGPELVAAFREFRAIWDPRGRMNPGKLVDARPLDADLRLGPGYRPLELTTRFRFPADYGSLARATERCVGVGRCRSLSGGGVMCPSFRATLEERHSTRGRARLLFEMFQGDPLVHRWRERAVRESLDLCLSCKGCRTDCPVNVDIATYKAEFLHHYYSRRLRPRIAYATGLLPWLAAAGSLAPGLANGLILAPGVSVLTKAAAGVAQERAVPHLARMPFTRWFAKHRPRTEGAAEVVLWPDTFTNRFSPEIAVAAVSVLEAAGYRVTVPSKWVCCGRPLYDQGMLSLAERLLRRSLRVLGPSIAAGTPVVVLEPSCATVFRDELPNLLAGDEHAKWLSQNTFTFAEFLAKVPGRFDAPTHGRKALVQTHCHQHAVMGFDADRTLMDRLGLEYEVLDAGCCGMAGAFGFERGEKYNLSMRIGERGVLSAVRAANLDTRILADGFSCREQIWQGARRRALHLAQVFAECLPDRLEEDPEQLVL